jgi:hypothetical protein
MRKLKQTAIVIGFFALVPIMALIARLGPTAATTPAAPAAAPAPTVMRVTHHLGETATVIDGSGFWLASKKSVPAPILTTALSESTTVRPRPAA